MGATNAPEIPDFERAYDYLDHYRRACPHVEAAVADGLRLTYADLKQRVDRCARALIAAGIGPGDRVAYLTPPHPEYLIVLFATLSVGGLAVGVNPRYSAREITHIVDDARPALFFSRIRCGNRSYREELNAVRARVPRLVALGRPADAGGYESFAEFLAGAGAIDSTVLRERVAATGGDSPSLLIYTSGTTGAPKGAVLNQGPALRHGKRYLARIRPHPHRLINYYPTNHVSGVVANTLQALVSGGTQVLLETFDPETVLRLIAAERITQWGGTPTMLELCAAHPRFATADLSSVQVVSWSGGALRAGLAQTLFRRVPRLATLYAMTETSGGVTAIDSDTFDEALCATVGAPLPDVETRLVDEAGEPVRVGDAGELLVRGACVMAGYWNNPEATRAAIDADGWLHTGDVARLDAAGRLALVGRRVEMFKSGGYNIYPREVETVLESHAQVTGAAVIGTSDRLYGEVGVAFVVTGPDEEHASDRALIDHCRANLANYKIPKRIVRLDALPLLANGKPDRRALAGQAEALNEHLRRP